MAMTFHCDPSDHCNAKGSERSTGGDWVGIVIFKHDEVAINQPLHFLSSHSKKVKATNRRENTGVKAGLRVTIHHVVFA